LRGVFAKQNGRSDWRNAQGSLRSKGSYPYKKSVARIGIAASGYALLAMTPPFVIPRSEATKESLSTK